MSNPPFHSKFNDQNPEYTNVLGLVLTTSIYSMFQSTLSYFTNGPPHRKWSYSYYANIKLIKDCVKSMANLNIVELQSKLSKIISSPLPFDAITESFQLETSKMVIEFIKKNAPGEWPEPANELGFINGQSISIKGYSSDKIVLYLHGGGYYLGSAEGSSITCYQIARESGCTVMAINYRLAPKNPYPCALIDALSAYLALKETNGASNIILAGDSAGAGLSIATIFALRDMGEDLPAAGYLISPYLDLTHSSPSWTYNNGIDIFNDPVISDPLLGERKHYYTTNINLKHPYVSPFWSQSFHQIPPLFIQAGQVEQLIDEIESFVDNVVKTDGNSVILEVYEAHVHVFPLLVRHHSASQISFQRAGEWIKNLEHIENHSTRIDLDYDGIEMEVQLLPVSEWNTNH
ncbi:Alpha/Beta hydrolase protein [Globomyces pollinis-pini]|nr:Alpha/Beta hydrolase protein [Globomyces pollinis-pini]